MGSNRSAPHKGSFLFGEFVEILLIVSIGGKNGHQGASRLHATEEGIAPEHKEKSVVPESVNWIGQFPQVEPDKEAS